MYSMHINYSTENGCEITSQQRAFLFETIEIIDVGPGYVTQWQNTCLSYLNPLHIHKHTHAYLHAHILFFIYYHQNYGIDIK